MSQNKPITTSNFINAFKKQVSKPIIKKINVKETKNEKATISKQDVSPNSSNKDEDFEKRRTFEIPEELNMYNAKSEVKINASTIMGGQKRMNISPSVNTSKDANLQHGRKDSPKGNNKGPTAMSLNNTRISINKDLKSERLLASISKSKNLFSKTIIKPNKIPSPIKNPKVIPVTQPKKLQAKSSKVIFKTKSPLKKREASTNPENASIKVKQVIANPKAHDNDMIKTLDLQTLDDPPIKQCK
jgi:hypothetical protein